MANSTAGSGDSPFGDPWAFQKWAFHVKTGNPGRKAVLAALASMAGSETGQCEAKHETLATWVEISRRSVIRHLEALREMGLIASRRQFRRDGSRRGDEYLLLAPWVDAWPDGEPVQSAKLSQPVQSANGDRSKVPTATKEVSQLSQQERPLKNDRLENNDPPSPTTREGWPGVAEQMQADGEEFLRQKRKVGSRLVTDREMTIAAAALAEFNRQLESRYELGPHLAQIVERVRDHPSWDAAGHVRLVQSAFRLKWWERRGDRRRAKPGVIWGPRAFPNVVDDATREAEVLRERANDRVLRDKVFDGRPWDEHTKAEQANLRESVVMGSQPWEASAPEPVVAVNGNGAHAHVTTAENWLDDVS